MKFSNHMVIKNQMYFSNDFGKNYSAVFKKNNWNHPCKRAFVDFAKSPLLQCLMSLYHYLKCKHPVFTIDHLFFVFFCTDSEKKGRTVKVDSAKKITLANKSDPLVIDSDKGRNSLLFYFKFYDVVKQQWTMLKFVLLTFTRLWIALLFQSWIKIEFQILEQTNKCVFLLIIELIMSILLLKD